MGKDAMIESTFVVKSTISDPDCLFNPSPKLLFSILF
jgi:hypothetical protein